MKKNIVLSLLLTFTLFAQIASAAPGDLDATFGSGGIFIDNSPIGYSCYGMYPTASALQPDGKILVVGKIYNRCDSYGSTNDPVNVRRVLLRRYLADGTPDATAFGIDGFAVADAPILTDVYGEGFDVLVQPDGYILVAGSKSARVGTTALVWRFTPQGELDQTFGNNGIVSFTSSGTYNASRKIAMWNGSIFIAGYSSPNGSYGIWVRKLNPDGSLNALFATGGKLTTGLETPGLNVTLAVSSTNGSIFVGGVSGIAAVVTKFFNSGTIFTNFGNMGTAVLPNCTPGGGYTPTYPIIPTDIRFQSTGKLLVASRMSYAGWAETPGIHRLTASGFVDTTFVDTTQAGSCNAIVQGSTWVREMPNDFFYSGNKRFFTDGPKDPTFVASAASAISADIQPADGKIVYVSPDTFIPAGKSYSDSRVKLFRRLP